MSSKSVTNSKFKIDGLDKELNCEFHQLKSDKLSKSFDVKVAKADCQEAIDFITHEFAKSTKIKGFRPGKVPLNIVKQQNLEAIMSEAAKLLIKHSSNQAIKSYKIAGEIDVDVKEFDEEKGLHYVVSFEHFPEFELPSFDKIKLTNYIFDVAQSDLDKSYKEISIRFKDSEPAPQNTKAKKGDIVLIDFVGKFAGTPFEGGTGKGHKLELGSGSFIDNFEDQLIGVKAGDKKTVKVTFPKEYHSKAHAGKEAEFDVEVSEVHHSKPAEINDDLAKKIGLKDFKDLEEKLKTQIMSNLSKVAHDLMKKDLFDELEGLCKFDCPAGMVKAEIDAIKDKFSPGEDLKDLEKMAERRVKLGILLANVASTEKLEVGEKDLQQQLLKVAADYPGQEKVIFEFYQKNPQALRSLHGPAIEDKAVAFIMSKVTKKDKKVTSDELVKLAESAS